MHPTWKSIAIGLISGTLLAYVVRPVLDRVPSTVLSIVGGISQRWADLIYRDAANPSSMEGLVLALIGLLLLIGSVVGLVSLTPNVRALFDTLYWRGIGVGMIFSLAAMVSFMGSMRASSAFLGQCFHRHVAILSPYLSDRESKELTASWVMMQSRHDFEAIEKTLLEYAGKYNVAALLKDSEKAKKQGICPAP